MLNNVLADKLKDVKIRTRRQNHTDWPSAVLHGVTMRLEHGLDARRINKLADFIAGLDRMAPIMRTSRDWADGPVMSTKFVHGTTPVKGYVLRAHDENGYGMVEYSRTGQNVIHGYWLSGFGLICWGWGEAMGMRAVADNGIANQLHQVLTAEPVWQRKFGEELTITQVTCKHVAAALRYFCTDRDADIAWGKVANAQRQAAPVNGTAPKAEVPKPASLRQTTVPERWKQLMMEDRHEEAVNLAKSQADQLERKVEELRAEAEVWRKKQAAAEVML